MHLESGIGKLHSTGTEKIIFLTGCINPDGMSLTKLQNPVIRRNQYLSSIIFYLENYDLPVLFVENSNTDIRQYLPKNIDVRRLEILTFDGNSFSKSRGKGYGEMAIIDHAIKNSVFYRNAEFIFKITGRHKVLNFASILNQANSDLTVDMIVDMWNMFAYADSRCWGASKDFISNVFINFWEEVDDSKGYNFEDALAKSVYKGLQLGFKLDLMKHTPRFRGSSGTENKAFNDQWIYWFPRNIVHIIKYLLNKR
ncbi:hypothetical protein [Pedobacter sp. KACC 23697]|uniref:Uncharacterized protein n=1 Tax=Pedobacter sp. KACC 23697 TaxID=3149230 RepID=A0AAU7K3S3_9SPHI